MLCSPVDGENNFITTALDSVPDISEDITGFFKVRLTLPIWVLCFHVIEFFES